MILGHLFGGGVDFIACMKKCIWHLIRASQRYFWSGMLSRSFFEGLPYRFLISSYLIIIIIIINKSFYYKNKHYAYNFKSQYISRLPLARIVMHSIVVSEGLA